MEGASGTPQGRRKRNGADRLDAIPASIARGDEFKERVRAAEGDVIRLSDMMAEAIAMDREARGLESVGRDGRATFCMERLIACHCLDAAREAYLRARGSNVQQLSEIRAMTREQAIARLKELQGGGDIEAEHSDADEVLCQLLSSLGYQDVVDEWNKVEKWYA